MKKHLLAFSLLFWTLMTSPTTTLAQSQIHAFELIQPPTLLEQFLVQEIVPSNLINWKVGDSMEYNISMGFFGKIGTSSKSVTKDEGEALWFQQTMKIAGRTETVEALIRKSDGKIIKLIRNGQEQQIPDDKIELISQDYTKITVPAGTFDVLHIVAKTKEISKLEIWSNPPQTVMDGTVKQLLATQLGDMVFELTNFKKGE